MKTERMIGSERVSRMVRRMREVHAFSLPIIFLVIFLVVTSFSSAWSLEPRLSDSVRVMTRNLYLGADIFRIVPALADPDPLAIPEAVAEIYSIMQYTDFVQRAEAVADEIQRYRPDLIGLQEVTTIRRQAPGDFVQGFTAPNAEETVWDYLDILTRALAARNLDYRVAAVVTNADVELPMLTGFDSAGAPTFDDVRLTDHDVILVRGDVDVANPFVYNYTSKIRVPVDDSLWIEFVRGFVAVDATVRGQTYRFVNTHLEVGGVPGDIFSRIQADQMQELLSILAAEDKTVILAGDFNSFPGSDPGSDVPYTQAVDAGYLDTWILRERKAKGYTCCFNETLDDPLARLYERIDHIFVLPRGKDVKKVRAKVVGNRIFNMTDEGLWPSDHAGVIVGIRFFRE